MSRSGWLLCGLGLFAGIAHADRPAPKDRAPALARALARQGLSRKQIASFLGKHPEARGTLAQAPSERGALFEGSLRDREAYFAAMDRSMPSKIGQLLPVFPSRGLLWEQGTGSGQQAAAYATYSPHLHVVGTDLDPQAIGGASSRYRLSNLSYFLSDALKPLWPANTVDAVVDSSMGHHLVSFGRGGFREDNIDLYRKLVFRALKPGGRYGLRDFVTPRWPARVRLSLPTEKLAATSAHKAEPPYGDLPRAALFRSFARDFRSHDFPEGVHYDVIPSGRPGWETFEVSGEAAANFLLRVNYTEPDSWPAELREQYTYFSQKEHVDSLARAGFRVDYAAEVHNPYMRRHWWQGKSEVADTSGRRLEFPPTNFLLYGTKPGPEDPVSLTAVGRRTLRAPSFMRLASYRHRETGQTVDLVHEPGVTHTYFPYEIKDGHAFLYVLPVAERPALAHYAAQSKLNRAHYGGYTAEGVAQVDQQGTDPVLGFASTLRRKAGLELGRAASRLRVEEVASVLPSPGLSDEIVRPFLIDLGGSGEKLLGDLKRVELNHLLAAAHVGSLPDPRLELSAYEIGRRNHLSMLSWFGEQAAPVDQPGGGLVRAARYADLGQGAASKAFEPAEAASGYARVEEVRMRRGFSDGRSDELRLELFSPRNASLDTIAVVPYAKLDGELHVGFESRDLAAFEQRGLGARAAVTPAWRLPKDMRDWSQARAFVEARLAKDFGARARATTSLGEGYFPSVGQTAEKVTPLAIEVDAARAPGLRFVPLRQLLRETQAMADLHTRLGIYRLAHMLGELDAPPR